MERTTSETEDAATADPELAALLLFDPAPRQNKRKNGWTAPLQRKFILHLALTGSPTLAAEALMKDRHGVEKVYKADGADSFRAAWDGAVALFEEREAERIEAAASAASAVARPPFVDRRRRRGGVEPAESEPEAAPSEGQQEEQIERLANKFLRKVVAERRARMDGEIAAADFYLRQITHLEVMFDLMASGAGLNAWNALSQVQRGGHSLLDIAETEFSQWLDAHRREFWAKTSEPMRPLVVRGEYLQDHGTHSTEPSHDALGKCTDPPPGVEREAWQAMDYDEQFRVRGEVFRQAAEDQVAWEEAARREYEGRARDGSTP